MSAYIQNFYKVFQSDIVPYLGQLESKRRGQLFKLLIIMMLLSSIAVGLGLCIHFSYWELSEPVFISLLIASIVFLGITIYLPFKFNSDLKKILKATCYPKILKEFDIRWDEQSFRISDHLINDSGMFESYNRVNITDTFEGVHNNIKFKLNEIEMIRVTGSGKHKSVVNVFKGILLSIPCFDSPSKLVISTKGKTLMGASIFQVQYLQYFLGLCLILVFCWADKSFFEQSKDVIIPCFSVGVIALVVWIYKNFIKRPELNTIISSKLRATNNSAKFDILSNDVNFADVILDSKLLTKFGILGKAFGVGDMKCVFVSGQILIALRTNKNLFEIGSLFSPLTNVKQMQILFYQLASILDLMDSVDSLDVDTSIQ